MIGNDVKASKIMVGNALWKQAPIWLRLWVLAFGRCEWVNHIGWRARIHWWQDKPYLVSIREVG